MPSTFAKSRIERLIHGFGRKEHLSNTISLSRHFGSASSSVNASNDVLDFFEKVGTVYKQIFLTIEM